MPSIQADSFQSDIFLPMLSAEHTLTTLTVTAMVHGQATAMPHGQATAMPHGQATTSGVRLALASFRDTLVTSWWERGAIMELWACADTHR